MELKDFYFKLALKTEPIIDDTTLRDGIQMPGLAAGPKDAARIAQLLSEVGVERIEMFHYQEPDKKAAKLIQDLNLNMRVAGWCRAVKEDIDSALQCGFSEVGISHPVSDMHFKAKWPDKTKDQILANVVDVVEYAAKTHGLRTFVHGEDSTRADWDFEKKFINAVARAGAECYRVCDTVGIGLSDPMRRCRMVFQLKSAQSRRKRKLRTSRFMRMMTLETLLKTPWQRSGQRQACGIRFT